MDRYVIVDTDGFAENTIIWDGTTSLTLPDGYCLIAEENCDARERPTDDINGASDGAVSAVNE